MSPARRASLLVAVASRIMRALLWTLRFRFTDRAGVLEKFPQGPLLWAFWHNRLFVMPYVAARYFPGRLGATLISESKDGAIIAGIVEKFSLRAIRGSSSRGGARSLIEMKRAVKDGYVVAVTPDGPRGPRYTLSPGVLKLAEVTGAVILPIHVTYSSCWRFRKSWDGFMIPKPFSTVEITFDLLHEVPAMADAEAFENQRARLERALRPEDGDWDAGKPAKRKGTG